MEDTRSSLFMEDESEYASLVAAFAAGKSLSPMDIERLAVTLGEYCTFHVVENDEYETWAGELSLLFRCFGSLPGSEIVLDVLCRAALDYISDISEQGKLGLSEAEKWLTKLLALSGADEAANRKILHASAHAVILTMINYLM
jgi:hypothetical protein